MNSWQSEREELYASIVEMYRRGLVGALSGNASLRLEGKRGDGLLLVTPTQLPYYRLKPEDLVVVDMNGESVGEGLAPSSETAMHLRIYREREDVVAAIHTHSISASAAAVAGREIPPILDEMVYHIGGGVPIGDYAFPGSEELAQVVCETMGDRNAVLLRNHGVLGVGSGVWEALEACDLVERAAQVFVLAQSFGTGGANPLPPHIIAAEQEIFQMKRRTSLGLRTQQNENSQS